MIAKQTHPSPVFPWILAPLLFVLASAQAAMADVDIFPSRAIEIGGHNASGSVSGDFNNDGVADVAVPHPETNDVGILLGARDGTFGPVTVYSVGHSPGLIAVADFNGDGVLDLAVANRESDDLSILLGVGNGTFEPDHRQPVGTNDGSGFAGPLAAGDLNNDGIQDLFICGGPVSSSGPQCALMTGFGDGSFGISIQVVPAGFVPSFVLADLDGDHNLDLIWKAEEPALISVMFGRGDGTFACPALSGCPAFGSIRDIPYLQTNLAVGDFDNDGRLDVAVGITESGAGGYSTGFVSILLAPADGQFARQIDFAPGMVDTTTLGVADFNRDGFQDIVATSHDGEIFTFLGCPAGVCVGPESAGGGTFREIMLGDFDGDGLTDLAGISGAMFVLKGRGDGGFGRGLEFRLGSSFEYPGRLAVQDFNEDGRSDLIVEHDVDSNAFTLDAFLGRGDGTFERIQPAASLNDASASPGVVMMGVADLDADGHLDVFRDYSHVSRGAGLWVFKGHGHGTFGPPQQMSGDSNTVAIGDFNGDGTNDLALAKDYQLSILLGESDGAFRPAANFGVDVKPSLLTVADLDSDGRLDLIVVDGSSSQVVVLLGSGDGIFRQASTTALESSIDSIVTGDFNGDGLLDVAAGGSAGVVCLLGRGDGQFGTPFLVAAGHVAAALVAGDFDNDGNLDIAFLNGGRQSVISRQGLGDVGLLPGRGDGSFEPVMEFLAGINAHGLAAADFDGDGRLDLVAAGGARDYGSPNNLWVLQNQGPFRNSPPIARVGPAAVAECSSPAGAMIVLDGAASTDPDSAPGTNDDIKSFQWFENFGTPSQTLHGSGQRFTVSLSLGQHLLTLRVTDSNGAIDTAQQTVNVVDTTPPLVVCPTIAPAECSAPGGSAVSPRATASDVCSPTVIVTNSRTMGGADASGFYLLGTTPVTFEATDESGNKTTCASSVSVRDTTSPSLTLKLSQTTLWPPNHRMMPVETTWQVSDVCDPAAAVVLAYATSSEPDDAPGSGDGSTTGDIQDASVGTPDTSVLLRAERSVGGQGRVYTLAYATTDLSGNTASALGTVMVPHDLGAGPDPVITSVEGDGTPGMVRVAHQLESESIAPGKPSSRQAATGIALTQRDAHLSPEYLRFGVESSPGCRRKAVVTRQSHNGGRTQGWLL